MESFDIFKEDKKIYNISTHNYTRACLLVKNLFPNNNNIKIVQKKKDNICSGCKEILDSKVKCSCWNFS